MSDHDEIIRTLLGMIVLYKEQYCEPLDLKKLSNKLEAATRDDWSPFTLKKVIAQCIKECPYEEILDRFHIDV